MKKIIIIILICNTYFLDAQIVSDVMLRFSTKGNNVKTVTFLKQTSQNGYIYSIKAENESTKDFNKCKWVNNLSQVELESLVNNMINIKSGSIFENHLFKIKNKNDNIAVIFNGTKCTSEHKTHYFQKSCNRSLSFKLLPGQIDLILDDLFIHLDKHSIVKN